MACQPSAVAQDEAYLRLVDNVVHYIQDFRSAQVGFRPCLGRSVWRPAIASESPDIFQLLPGTAVSRHDILLLT